MTRYYRGVDFARSRADDPDRTSRFADGLLRAVACGVSQPRPPMSKQEKPELVRRVPPMEPLGDLVLLIHEAIPETTKGGILLPEHKRRQLKGLEMGVVPGDDERFSIETPNWDIMIVIAQGPGRIHPDTGELIAMSPTIKVGARVVLKAGSSGSPRFMFEDEVYCITPAGGLLGVMHSATTYEAAKQIAQTTADLQADRAAESADNPLIPHPMPASP